MKPNQAFSMFRINCRLAERQKGWRFITVVFLALLSFSANPAVDLIFADGFEGCNLFSWNGGTTGAPVAGSPQTVSRVSGLCAMKLSAAGSVKDISPYAEPAAIMRFYVYAQLNSGTPVIFEAISDDGATGSLLTVTFDGSNFVFDAGEGASGNVLGKSGWNLVEMAWTGGSGLDYWVNVDSAGTPTGIVSAAPGAGLIESVVLGPQFTLDGTMTFDDYESHRETLIGGLLAGDGNQDGNINSGDINVIVNEFLFDSLGEGIPDCNLDGSINSDDIDCVVDIFLGL